MDANSESRQFWQRGILAIGILWGFLPFVLAPFITKGPGDSYFDLFASVLNSLTLLPACVLAYWQRRIACLWLSINAVIIASALILFLLRTGNFGVWMLLQVAGSVGFAVWLDVVEARHWPAPLEKKKKAVASF
jgi:hypothetical protein